MLCGSSWLTHMIFSSLEFFFYFVHFIWFVLFVKSYKAILYGIYNSVDLDRRIWPNYMCGMVKKLYKNHQFTSTSSKLLSNNKNELKKTTLFWWMPLSFSSSFHRLLARFFLYSIFFLFVLNPQHITQLSRQVQVEVRIVS